MSMEKTPVGSVRASAAMQVCALLLPVFRCAFCPACLGVFGGLFAGARFGFLENEGVHGALLLATWVVDVVLIGFAVRHHGRGAPLALCALGGAVAVAGHMFAEPVELIGFGMLMAAALWNVMLLRRHRKNGERCCASERSCEEVRGSAHEYG